jgi:hypothetical protein
MIKISQDIAIHLAIGKERADVYGSLYRPQYTSDLNAMHEAEKVLRGVMKPTDTDTIIGDRMHDYAERLNYAFDATAAQRAEAFLKTLNLWT